MLINPKSPQFLALLAVAAALLLVALGYCTGFTTAKNAGKATLALTQKQYEEEKRIAAVEYGKALVKHINQQREETARAATLEVKHLALQTKLATESAKYRKEIAAIARNSTHVFSPDFVQLYNAQIGARVSIPTSSAGSNTSIIAGKASPSKALTTRPLATVTEADLLEHMRYYGKRCQGLESQTTELIELIEGGQKNARQ